MTTQGGFAAALDSAIPADKRRSRLNLFIYRGSWRWLDDPFEGPPGGPPPGTRMSNWH